jgi:uracil-DNA glycosylase
MRLKRTSDRAAPANRVEPKSLEELNSEIASASPLVPGATCAVLGEAPVGAAAIALVGEQPCDQEDRQGRPCIEHAGLLIDRQALRRGAPYGKNLACFLPKTGKPDNCPAAMLMERTNRLQEIAHPVPALRATLAFCWSITIYWECASFAQRFRFSSHPRPWGRNGCTR